MTNPTGRGKYSKVIRELHDQKAALVSVMDKVLAEKDAEIERLRAIVRVNGLRWGHTHAEIDEILNQQLRSET